jgi:hypothetical protein
LRDAYPEIQAAGVELAVIGNGTPAEAAGLARRMELPFAVFTDPERGAFQAAGLRSSWAASFSPRVILNGIRAIRAGFRQHRMQGSALQQGGVLVLRAGGERVDLYVSKTGGDYPSTEWILDAAGRAG